MRYEICGQKAPKLLLRSCTSVKPGGAFVFKRQQKWVATDRTADAGLFRAAGQAGVTSVTSDC
jgi:hypothetical protein